MSEEKRRPGRPRKPDAEREHIDVRVTEELHHRVRTAAAAEGLSMGAWLKRLIEEKLGGEPLADDQLEDIAGGSGAGVNMVGRGGANTHVIQNRPSVVPRTGVG